MLEPMTINYVGEISDWFSSAELVGVRAALGDQYTRSTY